MASSDVAFIMIVLIDLFVRQTSNQYVQIFAPLIFYWHQVQNRNESWP
eukprot:CAMPEP_0181127428 /NCGR_PEP_ID=MMETSP1071-20121207/28194_1 /TAXON_ID=35127 /ORGANISM="Thalassiosira sp., Strain NH16" /LENGTH=47 /DNA_ID= /DNA_START= /DNA_END= /DNA_ORIENTATION=